MDVRELKALLNLMAENGVVELEIEDKKGKVRLVRGAAAMNDHHAGEFSPCACSDENAGQGTAQGHRADGR